MKEIELWHGDCLDMMTKIPNGSVDMVFADLPYAFSRENRTIRRCTHNRWDQPIDFDLMWAQLIAAGKKNAVFVFTAVQPYASFLIAQKPQMFRYDLVWVKSRPTGFLNSKKCPLRKHEHVLMFSVGKNTYNPQMQSIPKSMMQGPAKRKGGRFSDSLQGSNENSKDWVETGLRFPSSVLAYSSEKTQESLHPTQKPLALLRWIIKTYTNPGDLVLNPTAGSGTTAAACVALGRRCVAIEKDKGYYDIMVNRVKKAMAEPRQESLL